MSNNKHTTNKSSAGKGSAPRNCFSRSFKDNYDLIDWGRKNTKTPDPKSVKGFENDTMYCYNCGGHIDKKSLTERPELFIIHPDLNIEHKECNFN